MSAGAASLSQGPVIRVALSGCRDKAALMDAFARALALPSSFGRNWDALYDALRERPGCRVEVEGWTTFRLWAPAESAQLEALRGDLAEGGGAQVIDLEDSEG